jgi:putative transposase
MTVERIRARLGVPLEMLVVSTWPSVPAEAVPEENRALFLRRLKACELYCAGQLGSRAIARTLGFSASQVQRFVRAALTVQPDGQILGQRALIPYSNRRAYERSETSDTGTAGLFTQLLKRYPEVKRQIVTAYCQQGKRLKDIHRIMLVSLAAAGVTPEEYPFNRRRRAAGALHRFCQSLQNERFRQIAFARYGRDAGRRADKTTAFEMARHIIRPYTRIEVDGHRIDALFVLTIDGPDGVSRTVTLRRLVAISVIDVASRAILGFSLCLNHTESQSDLLTAIERSLSDAPPLHITESGLSPRAGSGLPAHLVPNCSFRLPDEIAFDNSLAACSLPWQDRLAEHLQCRVNVGTAGAPEGRAIIESYHKKLTENGYQRLPSTTGSSARSPKRRAPEAKAHHYHLTLSAAEQLLQVIIGEYNNTVHGTTHCTPLDYIRRWDTGEGLIRRLPKCARTLDFLYQRTSRLPVRGGVKTGMRPYLQFLGARYRNEQLANSGQLTGTYLTVCYDCRNIALMRLFLPNGEPLGIVRAQGRWGLSPHSLKTRRAILLLEKSGMLAPITADPIETYLAHLADAARNRRAAANELVRVKRERSEPVEASEGGERHEPPGHPSEVESSRSLLIMTSKVPPPVPKVSGRQSTALGSGRRTSGFQLTLGAGGKIRRAVRGG